VKTLAIDDYRNINADYVAKTFEDGVTKLKTQKWDLLYLDHDLGKYKKSGYDVMQFLAENKQFIPKIIICVSDSPGGKNQIEGMIKDIYGRVFDMRDVEALEESETRIERIFKWQRKM